MLGKLHHRSDPLAIITHLHAFRQQKRRLGTFGTSSQTLPSNDLCYLASKQKLFSSMPKSCRGGNKHVGTVRYSANKASPKSHEGLVKVVVHEVEDELVLQCIFAL